MCVCVAYNNITRVYHILYCMSVAVRLSSTVVTCVGSTL